MANPVAMHDTNRDVGCEHSASQTGAIVVSDGSEYLVSARQQVVLGLSRPVRFQV